MPRTTLRTQIRRSRDSATGTWPPRITIHRFSLVWLVAFSIIYHSKPSLVSSVDSIHRTKLLTTAMSILVAYTSLARTVPNNGKEKGKGKGENYEERHKAQFKIPVSRSQMRLI
ncbi:hypothetical protein K435DRAFT_866189 [Dendrothele bispora CBS 962.96]|uniref:Uncharacterized protein n=1 Tax=Dendrothele bispora (strain CBS 962.96) TaxID=1314807 RepID=A0A4V4HDT5_DENBC|nr:hypothetical protein K435DRAFT_866189 [Dendrothele bispora CBS 962.96]